MKGRVFLQVIGLLLFAFVTSCTIDSDKDIEANETVQTEEPKSEEVKEDNTKQEPKQESKDETKEVVKEDTNKETKAPEVTTLTYTVKHYQQKTVGDEYSLFETEKLTGMEGESTNAEAKEYEHFTAQDISQEKIATDGSTVISVYYDRAIISISFDPNGGTWGDASSDIKKLAGRYGASISLDDYPRKAGYGTIWDKEVQETFAFDETYTALYEAGIVNYKVKHYKQNIEDDAYPEDAYEIELKTGKVDSQTEAEAKSYVGFINPQIIQKNISADGSTEIRIEYERQKYSINFMSLGGTLVGDQSVKYGAKATVPDDPVKANYDFKGWFISSDEGITFAENPFDFDTEVSGGISLYAKWEVVSMSYTVKHFWQNIENDNYTEKESEFLNGKFGEQTIAEAKTYTGFTAQSFSQQIINSNSTIVEIFYDRDTYTVCFDSKGGSEVNAQIVRYDGNVTIPQNPTKNPYDFIGWYTSNDNGNTLSENTFDFNNYSITEDITLYANWYLNLSNCTADDVVAKIKAMRKKDTVVVKGEMTAQTLSAIKNAITNNFYTTIDIDLYEVTGIENIPNSAFYGCKNLTSITLPAGVKSIDSYAFYKCPNLRNVVLPEGLLTIKNNAFQECTLLYTIVFPRGLTTIDDCAFRQCKALKNITIPETVTRIGIEAFGWSGVESITIPGNINAILGFPGCNNITFVIIENGVKYIGSGAFDGCIGLTNITIPASVIGIWSEAFASCKSLENITFNGTKEQWNAIQKDVDWNYRKGYSSSKIPATKVVCIDGFVELD